MKKAAAANNPKTSVRFIRPPCEQPDNISIGEITVNHTRIRDLPGPRGLPLIGNALQIETTRLHQIAEGWSRVYGEKFRFRMPGREFMVVANPDVIASVLRDRPDGFQRTPRLNAIAREMGFGG